MLSGTLYCPRPAFAAWQWLMLTLQRTRVTYVQLARTAHNCQVVTCTHKGAPNPHSSKKTAAGERQQLEAAPQQSRFSGSRTP